MTNVAIIGTGYIGKVHLDTLMRLPGVRVIALVDTNEKSAQQLAEKYNIKTVSNDYRQLLGDEQIDVFHNCTPNDLHFEINKAVLEAGKHLFTEKPLAVNARQACILRDLAVLRGALTGIGFCYRYYPAVQEAAARVRAGEVGRVHTVFGSYFQDWLLYDTDYSWRLDKQVAGDSNAMADIGSHWCDLAQFVANSPIIEVMADLKTIHPVRQRSKSQVLTFARADANSITEVESVPVEVDDYGSVLFHLANGAAGSFAVCQLSAGRKCTIDLQVYGTEAGLAWNHERPSSLWIGHRDRASEVLLENPLLQKESTARFARLPSGHPLGYYDAIYNLFAEFYHAIALRRDGQSVDVAWPTLQEGYEEMLILEAILTSQAESRWVKVSRE